MGHIENEASNNTSIVACVFVTAVKFLPSRCLATAGGFLPSHCLATIRGLLPSRCLATIGGIHKHTQTTWYHKPTIFFQNKESRLKRALNTDLNCVQTSTDLSFSWQVFKCVGLPSGLCMYSRWFDYLGVLFVGNGVKRLPRHIIP
jgi:hypothetical protein